MAVDTSKLASKVKRANERLSALEHANLASKVKRANERLRALERANLDNSASYKAIETLATDRRLYMGQTKNGEIKFRTDIKKLSQESPQNLRALERQVDKFLKSATSTKKGIAGVYDRAYEQATKSTKKDGRSKEAFKGSKNDYLEAWGNASFKKFSETFGSDEAVKMYNASVGEGKMSMNEFNNFLNANLFDIDKKQLSTIQDDLIQALIKKQKIRGRNAKKKKQELYNEYKTIFESWLNNEDEDELPFD